MNERIESLIELAEEWNTDGDVDKCEVDLYKFAELLLQECMNAVCDPSTTYLESMTDASAMYTARERIRKHFGGEE